MRVLCEICQARTEESVIVSFLDLSDKLQKAVNDEVLKSTTDNGSVPLVCPCCLGLLQPPFVAKLLAKLKCRLDEEQYDDTTSFNLCISFPLAIFIRDRIIQIQTGKSDITAVAEDFKNLRDVCKFCYRNIVGKSLNIQSDIASDFNICFNLKHELDDVDISKIHSLLRNEETEIRSKRFRVANEPSAKSRSNLIEKLSELNAESVERFFGANYLRQNVIKFCEFEINFERQPLFIGGRYCKYSRYVHQTPWVVDGEKRSKCSVQELIYRHLAADICRRPSDIDVDAKFTASGREDADVRMLGDGRPFAIQLANPKRRFLDQNRIDQLAAAINADSVDIEVNSLKIVTRKDFDWLNKTNESKPKHYAALCYFCDPSSTGFSENAVPELNFPLEIVQKTPIRVLHRRPLIDRKRQIYNMTITPVDNVHFQLLLTTEAGTYIKEFVHGDFGRTKPSLCDILGIEVDILDLDVEKVDVEWPPKVNTSGFSNDIDEIR